MTEIVSVSGGVRRQAAGYPVDECYTNIKMIIFKRVVRNNTFSIA